MINALNEGLAFENLRFYLLYFAVVGFNYLHHQLLVLLRAFGLAYFYAVFQLLE